MNTPIENLKTRSRALTAIREFFHTRDFIEVETPVRIAAPAQETHIEAPPAGSAWLRASPELQMKQMLVAGCNRIYQIGPCFRANECGRRHNPEFTMLEWYRAEADYLDILQETRELITHVVKETIGSTAFTYQGSLIDLSQPWPIISVREAYLQGAGWDPVTAWDGERFDLEMTTIIEPALPRNSPCILTDYPAPAASLARLKHNDPQVAERWELYIGGLEIANAYSELCDPHMQRQRFELSAQELQKAGKAPYPVDEDFFTALERGMPPCGGIALGIDRLIMLLCDAPEIGAVRAFCQSPGALL